ncbi:MAG: response regulator [Desulfobacterales bacterium]|nr:response regulator [Desulfobacterales bacterium]
MKILIVEDNEDSRILLESALNANGYEVQSSENGKLALERAVLAPPDLIISDILMPEMDGYTLCQQIKASEQLRDVPFIFYTATYTDPQNEKLALDLGAAKFIVKPMEINLLLREIQAVLENAKENSRNSSSKSLKNEFEMQKDYSKIIAKKLDAKVRELEEEKDRLAVSEQKYRRLIEALRGNYFFYTHDESGVFSYISPSITSVLGYSPEDFKNNFAEYLTQRDINNDLMHFAEQSMKGAGQPPYEIEICHNNGSIHRLEITEVPILNSDGQVLSVEGIAHDITQRIKTQEEREKLQKRLIQAQKMEAIGTLAGGIAHDFNNILSAILGYTELSKLNFAEESTITGYLDNVMQAGNRAKELVQQILTFSRQTEKELKPVSVKTIVRETLKLLRASLPSTIEIKCNTMSDSLVMGDPTQIHQLIMNLCVNAGHAMREKGGILEVALNDLQLNEDFKPQFSELKPGSYLNLIVGDTGNGMSPEVLERIFDPFFTTKERGEGTGMGLAVVHGIVRSSGGAIHVYSEMGKGTTFNIYLPAIESALESDTDLEEVNPRGKERILFIDDEPNLVEIGEQMLKSLGYQVETRMSSLEALKLFRAHSDHFDLVISDMTMPQMTGDKLAREVTAIRKDIPVILCTGFSYKITEDKTWNKSIKGLLMKPIVRSELAQMVRKVLDGANNLT